MIKTLEIDMGGMVLDCRINHKPIAAISLQTLLTYGKIPVTCKECGLLHTYAIVRGRLKVWTTGIE